MKMIGHDHFICHSLIVIFPCFLTYFYPTGHDVPEEV